MPDEQRLAPPHQDDVLARRDGVQLDFDLSVGHGICGRGHGRNERAHHLRPHHGQDNESPKRLSCELK
jgi:hypothetical protein